MKKAAPSMKPGAGGTVQNAKAQASVKQNYGKAGAKHPAKPGGMSGDKPPARKGSPLSKKKR